MHTIENAIFSNLVSNQEYFARVFPHLKPEYFRDHTDRVLLKQIKKYAEKYQSLPSKQALSIMIDKLSNLSGDDYNEITDKVKSLNAVPEDLEWLVNETESFCQRQAMNNALAAGLRIKENADKPADQRDPKIPDIGAITDIMKDALSVCFDTSVGHDYFEDWAQRWQTYVQKVAKIPCGINMLNKVTHGGVERGTLNIILAGVNVGKSLGLCHLAADYLVQGLNVLYISMEMAESVVAKRIDANLINVSMDNFDTLTEGTFGDRIKRKKELVGKGKLIIKQYPTAGAHVGHFNSLLTELRTKKDFVPDVVIVDYLGICASSRIRGGTENSYHLVKSIAEELRGFAVEHDVVVWSAAQTTRGAWGSSDVGMEDTAESAGLPATADFMIAVIETEETLAMGQQCVKQIKSRYGDKAIFNKFMIAVDKGLQRWSDVDENMDTTPAQPSTPSKPNETKGGFRVPAKGDSPGGRVDVGTGEITW